MAIGYGDSNGPTAIPAQDSTSLESVVGLSDQVDATVNDVMEAWRYFCYGSANELTTPASPPYPSDKLMHAHGSLQDSIRRLADLAREIRQRA